MMLYRPGRTAYERRRLQILNALGPVDRPWRERFARFWPRLGPAVITNAVLFLALAVAGYWWLYPVLWLLPLVTWYQLITRVRNIAEHAMVPDNDDPLRNTRTTSANPLARLLVAPYRVNYHLEHHLFLFVPCWRLPAAHRMLVGKGLAPRMELQPGYAAVLRVAASATVDRRRGRERAAEQI